MELPDSPEEATGKLSIPTPPWRETGIHLPKGWAASSKRAFPQLAGQFLCGKSNIYLKDRWVSTVKAAHLQKETCQAPMAVFATLQSDCAWASGSDKAETVQMSHRCLCKHPGCCS
ncbi:UNVERIFIED_CONTAM: hypothetical protein K2H54_045032 [Gekko kuhli]